MGDEIKVGTKIRLDGKYSGVVRYQGELEGALRPVATPHTERQCAHTLSCCWTLTLDATRVHHQGAKASGWA